MRKYCPLTGDFFRRTETRSASVSCTHQLRTHIDSNLESPTRQSRHRAESSSAVEEVNARAACRLAQWAQARRPYPPPRRRSGTGIRHCDPAAGGSARRAPPAGPAAFRPVGCAAAATLPPNPPRPLSGPGPPAPRRGAVAGPLPRPAGPASDSRLATAPTNRIIA